MIREWNFSAIKVSSGDNAVFRVFMACSSSSCEVGEEEEVKCLKRRGEGEGGKGSFVLSKAIDG